MLERATGCLETGSRCVRASRNLSYRSRRSLHSAFWTHGASNIRLPSWWLSLLQQHAEESQSARRLAATARKYLTAGLAHGSLLDFLYPTRALTLIHKLALRDAIHTKDRVLRRPRLASQRLYSGIATEALSTHANPEYVTNLLASWDDSESKSEGGAEAGAAMTKSQDPDAIPLLKNRLKAARRMHQELEDKMLDEDPSYHPSKATMRASLEAIDAIGAKLLAIYAGKVLDRFHASDTRDRSSLDYRLAVISAIASEQLDMAVLIAIEDLTRQGDEALAVLAPHLLLHQKWDHFLDLWQACRSAGNSMSIDGFLVHLDHLDVNQLLVGARKLCVYLTRGPTTGKWNERSQSLIAGLAKQAFSRRDAEFSLIYHYRLFNLLRTILDTIDDHFHLAVDQLLWFQGTDALREAAARKALSIYALMRTREKLVPKRELMEALIARLCEHHWGDLTEVIVTDHERFYGRPAPAVLEMLWLDASRQGNEALRSKLVERYGEIRTSDTPIARFNQELAFYFRRLESDKLIVHFESAGSIGIIPNVQSWNLVLMVHARIPDIEGALRWYSKMLESGLEPDSLTYRTLANMYSASGDVLEVQQLIDKSQSAGFRMHSSLIDSMVHALIKNEELDRAEMLVASAASMDLKGSRTRMWNYLLSGVALRGDLMRVKHLHDEMLAAGVADDEMTYAALMLCLCVRGLPKYAYSILRKFMPTQNRIRLLPIHFAIVLGGFITKEMYGEVFNAYKFMISLGLRPSWSAQTIFLKAVANHELKRLEKAGAEPSTVYLRQAETLLDDLLSNLDPVDLRTREPLRGVDDQRLDEAYLANYFEFLIFSYGRSGNMARVSALFDRYLAMSQARNPDTPVSPPMKMIAALMSALYQQNLHDNVEQLWELALTKARELASASFSVTGSAGDKPSIFPSRRLILTRPLNYYLLSLTRQSRSDTATTVLTTLQQQGYAIANSTWNLYVEALLSTGHHTAAFTVAEAELMSGWRGWPVRGGYAAAIKADLARQLPPKMHMTKRMPTYTVLVRLAAAYMDERRKGAFQPDQTRPLEELGRLAPTVVKAVTEMPRMDDEVQGKYLRRW